MRKYKYNHFSFSSQENEELMKTLLGPIDITESHHRIEVRTQDFIGDFFVKRIFQWSNGNVTVIGHIL